MQMYVLPVLSIHTAQKNMSECGAKCPWSDGETCQLFKKAREYTATSPLRLAECHQAEEFYDNQVT